MTNRFDPTLEWLARLAAAANQLPRESQPRPYYSQRLSGTRLFTESSLPEIVRRVRALVAELDSDHYFADAVGFDCVDSYGDSVATPESELERRVGKPELWQQASPEEWSEEDLCDFIEVFHDLASRPTLGFVHGYSGCGFHPTRFSRKSGQALYRWRMNELIATTTLSLRLAEHGEDIGRMVRQGPGELDALVDSMLTNPSSVSSSVAHAVALFRSRTGTREEHRSAIVELAGILEARRDLLEERLWRKDEGALFHLANDYDLRHRDPRQYKDYGPEFLEWIFYWYLATVQLTDHLLARPAGEG